jgi:DNA-binding response OmpR family regulator
MTAHILVVEDDENLRVTLRDNLEMEGFSVAAAVDGNEALQLSKATQFDVVLLDVMMPGMDGYAVCAALRTMGCQARVLMLTARTLEEDIVRGLDAGADDYLVKPYRLRELLARVRALLRRGTEPRQEVLLRCGPYTIDTLRREVIQSSGDEIKLTKTEFDLLVYFVHHRGLARRRSDLLQDVWQGMALDERTVDNFVSNLKKKLRWQPGCGFEIHTLRGVGYRFES